MQESMVRECHVAMLKYIKIQGNKDAQHIMDECEHEFQQQKAKYI